MVTGGHIWISRSEGTRCHYNNRMVVGWGGKYNFTWFEEGKDHNHYETDTGPKLIHKEFVEW